jgi:hypothetical protein
MFAPNPPLLNTFTRVLVEDRTGQVSDLRHDIYGRRRYPYLFHDRMGKVNRRLIEQKKEYETPYAAWVCRPQLPPLVGRTGLQPLGDVTEVHQCLNHDEVLRSQHASLLPDLSIGGGAFSLVVGGTSYFGSFWTSTIGADRRPQRRSQGQHGRRIAALGGGFVRLMAKDSRSRARAVSGATSRGRRGAGSGVRTPLARR